MIVEGVVAIFGPTSKITTTNNNGKFPLSQSVCLSVWVTFWCPFLDVVALLANATGIPHLLYDWNRDSSSIINGIKSLNHHHRLSVNVAPSSFQLRQAYADLIQRNFNWKSFTILFDDHKGIKWDEIKKLQNNIN